MIESLIAHPLFQRTLSLSLSLWFAHSLPLILFVDLLPFSLYPFSWLTLPFILPLLTLLWYIHSFIHPSHSLGSNISDNVIGGNAVHFKTLLNSRACVKLKRGQYLFTWIYLVKRYVIFNSFFHAHTHLITHYDCIHTQTLSLLNFLPFLSRIIQSPHMIVIKQMKRETSLMLLDDRFFIPRTILNPVQCLTVKFGNSSVVVAKEWMSTWVSFILKFLLYMIV